MAFSLSSWFKGKPNAGESDDDSSNTPQGKQPTPPPSVPPPAPSAPAPAVRTVMPSNAQNPVSLRTPGAPSAPGAKPPVTRSVSVRPPARKVSFPVPSAGSAPGPVAPAAPVAMTAPPALPPAPDAAVNLKLGDFIDRLPPGFLAPGGFDRQRVVEFRASELYSDLSKGRASVPASTIYAKCPEIFARPVTDTEDMEVQLPLQKLVEQLSAAFQTRSDQVAEESVGQIETPFLQVALEDSTRLPKAEGTSAGAIRPAVSLPVASAAEANHGLPQRPAHRTGQISTISANPSIESPATPTFAPPSAPPINPGKRPPSTVRASVAGGKIRLSGPAAVARIVSGPTVPPPLAKPPGPSTTQRIEVPKAPSASPSHQVTKKTARIQIPPISLKPSGGGGAGRSLGSMPVPAVPVQPSPVTIHPTTGGEPAATFRSSPPPPPSIKLPPPSFAPPRPSFPPPGFPAVPPGGAAAGTPSPAISVPPPASAAPADHRKIELGLAAVLRGQPASALAVEPEEVADDLHFTLPFALIEKQLSSGRVAVPRQIFLDALPESHRHVLAEDSGLPEVQIPLQEVFQNLPGNALNMRQDQVVEEVGHAYPTPFSQKAEEDAERLGTGIPVAPPPAAAAAPEPPFEPVPEEVSHPASASLLEEETALGPSVEQAFAPAEEPATEEKFSPSEAPDRDVPLDPEEALVVEPAAEEPTSAAAELPVPELGPTEEAPSNEQPVVAEGTSVHPAEAAVEPPMAVEPTPVAEALAVLESTAPGEDERPEPPAKPAEETFAEEAATPGEASGQSLVAEELPPVSERMESIAAPTAHHAPLVSQDTELQTALMTEEELDAKGVVRHVSQLPGITGCAVMFADGLLLAGNFPEGDTEGFSAMAPPFFKRAGNFVAEADLGTLHTITLYTDRGLLSFFMHEDICLSVRHTGRGFLPGVREKLATVTRELARMYATEKPAGHPGDSAS